MNKKPDNEKRIVMRPIRFTRYEIEYLTKKAKENGMSFSEYVRTRAMQL